MYLNSTIFVCTYLLPGGKIWNGFDSFKTKPDKINIFYIHIWESKSCFLLFLSYINITLPKMGFRRISLNLKKT